MEWTDQEINNYANRRHGPDGALLFDPVVKEIVSQAERGPLVDAGCGTGFWSIVAARAGFEVYAVDIADEMARRTIASAKEAGVSSLVRVRTADATALPFTGDTFQVALSINVGPLLTNSALERHIKEIARVLRPGGVAVFGVPDSFGTVFTAGKRDSNELREELTRAIQSLPPGATVGSITETLSQFEQIYRATLGVSEKRLSVSTRDEDLTAGQTIWRKLPGLAVPNIYHPVSQYEELLEATGLRLVASDRPCFDSRETWERYNTSNGPNSLGEEYIGRSPYCIMTATKG